MLCDSMEECFSQISEYFNGKSTGYPLIFDTEDVKIYSEVVQRLEADSSKKCIFVSNSCQKNELPDLDFCLSEISGQGSYVLIGTSQALMLKSESDLESFVDMIIGHSISGYALIILYHCKKYIQKFENRDPRVSGRTIISNGEFTPLWKIELVMGGETGSDIFQGVQDFLKYVERITFSQYNEKRPLLLKTKYSRKFFGNALYQIVEADSIYEKLSKQCSDIAASTQKNYGTDEQWEWLYGKVKEQGSFSKVILEELGVTSNFELMIQDIFEENIDLKRWLYWLALKSFGTNNAYLNHVLDNCDDEKSFKEHIYLDLSDIEMQIEDFETKYLERKKILNRIPDDLPLIAKYCMRIGKYEKNAVYYLTDKTENERFEFMRCLSIYEYTEDELYDVAEHFSSMLNLYMRQFNFDRINTVLSDKDSELREILTQYFQEYKIQKITNKLHPYFEDMVKDFASERPYNKLRPRSSIVSQLDRKDMELFFFDALGVEYLSFIKEKCNEYGLLMEIRIGHGELPSITSKNKEFIQYFDGQYRKIDELDELKHHSQIYDYEKRKEPIHLFKELEIIDAELRRIQSFLVQETGKKAIIVSDHGASRLAVLKGKISDANQELEEKGIHSGRCCPVDEDPKIKYAAYEDGYAVFADYERFKGGRMANVEVHGGATLEEVVVPIIVLSRRPEKIEYCFTNPVIRLKQKEIASLTLYCNIPMHQPRICVGNKFYDGEFVGDNKHAKFLLPEIKRSKEYIAKIYDGDTDVSVNLSFKIQKSMGQEIDLFS